MNTATGPTTSIREVDAPTACQWLDSGQAILLDVREPDENARERIKGSRLNPLTRFDPAAAAPPAGQKVIHHCKRGQRSMETCRLAASAGFGPVYSLTGGIDAWKAA